MATKKTTSTAKTTSKTSTTKEKAVAEPQAEPVEQVQQYKVRAEIDDRTVVTVKNGFPGVLAYVSRKTGEEFIWPEYSSELEMEYSELKAVRNTKKAYFENNWFLIDDPNVLDCLGVSQFYRYASRNFGFEKLFDKTPAEIKADVAEMNSEQKRSVSYRARQLIKEGTLDSIKKITALEEALGVELVER